MFIDLGYFLLLVAVSVAVNLVIIYFSHKLELGMDYTDSEQHKIHKKNVPRLGGIGIYAPFIITFLFFRENKVVDQPFMLFATFPFIIGLIEDVYRNTSANFRFTMLAFVSFLTMFLVNENVIVSDIGFKLPFYFAMAFTVFAFTGITNSINIIDGLNGLSSGISLTAIFFMALLSYQNQYPNAFNSLFLLGSSILGFFIINFFTGKIFLGDSGAYFIGFVLSMSSALLANRGSVSPWFFTVLLAYPIFDTLFSIYRRRVLKGEKSFSADAMHMHTLLYKRVFRDQFRSTVFILLVNGLFSWGAYRLRESTPALIALFLLFCGFYAAGYRAIVKFKIKR